MKFHCEYCRELIDAEKDKKCPSCGATYKNNKEYEKLLNEREQQKEQIKKQQEFVQKQIKRVGVTGGIFAIIIPIFAFAIMGTIIFIGLKEAKKNNNKFDNVFNDIENNAKDKVDSSEEPKIIVVNQEKTSSDYKIKFEQYKILEEKNNKEFNKLEVKFIVEKISDEFTAWGEEFYCLVNNVSQEIDHFNSDISTYIKDKNVPTAKTINFYIPKNTDSFDIKYGNKISFHIDIEND